MDYQVIKAGGESRSFPDEASIIQNSLESADVVVLIGAEAGTALREIPSLENKKAVLIELGGECLGVHTGESKGKEGSNILGFSRFRLGNEPPSDLVEIVRQPNTDDSALDTAKQLFAQLGLEVAVSGDFAGRIIDRLVRPYFNEALRRLDEGLATAEDLDLTLKLGLGYPEGPIELLERSGLDAHYEVTKPLFEVYGERAFAPARRALVAKQRKQD